MSSSPSVDAAALYRPSYVRALLAAQQIRLKQSLGQNFLCDRNVVEKIVRCASLQPDDVVLEIGAGIGHLTCALARHAASVIAVEIDARLIPITRAVLDPLTHVTLVHADILAAPLRDLCRQQGMLPTVIVANLPYYITSPVVLHVINAGLGVRSMTLTVQKEAAARLIAEPGQRGYGATAVLLHLWGAPQVCAPVAPACFFPQPQVRSCVLHVTAHQPPRVPAHLAAPLRALVHHAFNQRRKTLHNALAALCGSPAAAGALLAAAHLDPAARAEALSPADFLRLAGAYTARS